MLFSANNKLRSTFFSRYITVAWRHIQIIYLNFNFTQATFCFLQLRPNSMPCSFSNQAPWQMDRGSPDDFDQHWIILSNSDFLREADQSPVTNNSNNRSPKNNKQEYIQNNPASPMSPTYPEKSVDSKSSSSYNFLLELINEVWKFTPKKCFISEKNLLKILLFFSCKRYGFFSTPHPLQKKKTLKLRCNTIQKYLGFDTIWYGTTIRIN